MEKNIDWLERCNREEKIKLAVVGSVVIIGTRNSCDDTNECLPLNFQSSQDSVFLLREIYIRKKGKGNALNEGIRHARNDLISGAFGVFRKSTLLGMNGYDIDTVGEDMELVLRLQKQGFQQSKKQIVYEPTAVCYTGVPHSIKRLLHQRDRWQRGLMDCLIKHHNLIANPRYGLLGLVTMCYQLMVELLGPIFWVIYTVLLIDKNMFPFFFGGVCRICFGANRTDDICSIHRYREKYGESFEVDTETDFNNNRRNGVANTHYGSEGSWNAYIPLAKTCLVDLIFSQYCRV